MLIPYQRGSDTSKAAAESQKGRAPAIIERIYRFLVGCGEGGATDDEIKIALGLLASTAGARRRDLETMGGCVKTKMRRTTMNGGIATVHVAIPGASLSKKRLPGRPRKDKTYSEKVMTYLRPDTLADIRIIAEGAGSSVSTVVREAVRVYVSHQRYIADYVEDNGRGKCYECGSALGPNQSSVTDRCEACRSRAREGGEQ
jgi:hypothetical protein